jgi:hypothetical protein
MDAPITRRSNIGLMPLAGTYLYTDFPGAEPVKVVVAVEEGITLVRFPPLEGDEGAELILKDMAACENWREHFARIA